MTTIARFVIRLSYYTISCLQHPVQFRAGGLFVCMEFRGKRDGCLLIALRGGVGIAAGGALLVVQLQQTGLTGGPSGYDVEHYGQIVVEVGDD